MPEAHRSDNANNHLAWLHSPCRVSRSRRSGGGLHCCAGLYAPQPSAGLRATPAGPYTGTYPSWLKRSWPIPSAASSSSVAAASTTHPVRIGCHPHYPAVHQSPFRPIAPAADGVRDQAEGRGRHQGGACAVCTAAICLINVQAAAAWTGAELRPVGEAFPLICRTVIRDGRRTTSGRAACGSAWRWTPWPRRHLSSN
eukprot:scaffold637_cov118-Isochrysis_galbana.AAC.13